MLAVKENVGKSQRSRLATASVEIRMPGPSTVARSCSSRPTISPLRGVALSTLAVSVSGRSCTIWKRRSPGISEIALVMLNGGTIVLMTVFAAKGYIRAIDRHRVSMITSVPTMLALNVPNPPMRCE